MQLCVLPSFRYSVDTFRPKYVWHGHKAILSSYQFRNEYFVDGGLSDNLPKDGNTITVQPWEGGADICPRDGFFPAVSAQYFLKINLKYALFNEVFRKDTNCPTNQKYFARKFPICIFIKQNLSQECPIRFSAYHFSFKGSPPVFSSLWYGSICSIFRFPVFWGSFWCIKVPLYKHFYSKFRHLKIVKIHVNYT